jgi:hypothetical protein
MLDLVQPLAAGRQLIRLAWEARRDEPGREGTLQHAALIKLGNNGSQMKVKGSVANAAVYSRAFFVSPPSSNSKQLRAKGVDTGADTGIDGVPQSCQFIRMFIELFRTTGGILTAGLYVRSGLLEPQRLGKEAREDAERSAGKRRDHADIRDC